MSIVDASDVIYVKHWSCRFVVAIDLIENQMQKNYQAISQLMRNSYITALNTQAPHYAKQHFVKRIHRT